MRQDLVTLYPFPSYCILFPLTLLYCFALPFAGRTPRNFLRLARSKLISDSLRPGFEKPQRTGKRTWLGRILNIDRFGNIVTNFHVDDFPDLEGRDFSMAIGSVETGSLLRAYAECAPGELFVISGSSGFLEVSVSQGSAAGRIGCQTGASAELTLL